jgi:DNA-binding NarL/FixJ family response regulator
MRRKYSQRKLARAKDEFRGTVLIADDHALYRMGLVQLLRDDLKTKKILEANSFAESIEHLKDKDVTLVILDLGMTGMSSPKDIARMRLLRPDVLVVVLSASDHREDILEALSAGVHGYIVKNQDLIGHLRYILSGEVYVPPILAEQAYRVSPPEEQPLTSRQRQVLEGIVAGKSNKEIAQALNIAEGTVKLHLAGLFRLLGATNRAHVAALGKQLTDRQGGRRYNS